MINEQTTQKKHMEYVRMQGVGGIVTEENRQNALKLMQKLHEIDVQNATSKASIERDLDEALKCIDKVRDFVGDPSHILGNAKSKHGETAEQANIWFHNADRVIYHKKPDASKSIDRTGPEDYFVNGIAVQSKYINGTNNSLSAVIEHMGKYEWFGQDASYYVIPKDQYAQIQKIISGDASGLNQRSISAIREKIAFIEEQTGRKLGDIVRPGEVTYPEVQLGKIMQTCDNKATQIEQVSTNRKNLVDEKSEAKRLTAKKAAEPSWKKIGKAAVISAAFAGVSQLSIGIYSKCKQGTAISDFTSDDWKDLGIDTSIAATEGGISGAVIYGATNYSNISSPVAAAGVSLIFGVAELTYQRNIGVISQEEFEDSCGIAAVNAAVTAVGAMAGETFLPIPVLGAVIGSFIASEVFELLCQNGLHEALSLSSFEINRLVQKMEYSAECITISMARTNQYNKTTQAMHRTTQSSLDNFDRKKR